jgi:peptidoglycan hydrolase-like protein with peptidoglycan-binding domain
MADVLRAPKRKPAKSDEHGFFATLASALWRSTRRQPALAAAILVFGGLGATTIVNALVLQSSRHPAMLFSDVSPTRTAQKIATAPTRSNKALSNRAFLPPKAANGFSGQNTADTAMAENTADPFIADLQNELAKRGLYTGTIDGQSGAKTQAAIRAYEERLGMPVTGVPSPQILKKLATAPEPQPALKDDQDPLRGVIQEATPAAAEEQANITKVQAALNALGFGPLDEDGMSGKATREAIEAFERSKKLTPTGEATGKTLKALQRASGVAKL